MFDGDRGVGPGTVVHDPGLAGLLLKDVAEDAAKQVAVPAGIDPVIIVIGLAGHSCARAGVTSIAATAVAAAMRLL